MTESKAESIVRVLGVIGDSDPAFLDLIDTLFKYISHKYQCDYLQPMWHKGPCDCGLHALTAQFPQWLRERLLAKTMEDSSPVYGPDPHGLFAREE